MKRLSQGLLFLIGATLAGVSLAAGYPEREVRIIVPYAAGGGGDTLTRLVGQALSEAWKQPVVIDNRPGAGATIGTDHVAKSKPDGYTLLMTANTIAVSPSAYPNLPYDVLKDFQPITLLAQTPYVLTVSTQMPVDTVEAFLSHARSKPGALNYGSPGKGTLSHLTYELFRSRTGVDAAVIAYKGSNPALLAAISGQIDFVIDTPAAVMPHVRSGKLKALAVTSAKPSAAAPGLPALADKGAAGMDVMVWFGFMAPAGTPADVVQRVHDSVKDVLSRKDMTEALAARGMEVATLTPAAFSELMRNEVAQWADVVKRAGIKFD